MGNIYSISISEKTGTKKHNVPKAIVVHNHGIEKDAHAGFKHRQVSFLAKESIDS